MRYPSPLCYLFGHRSWLWDMLIAQQPNKLVLFLIDCLIIFMATTYLRFISAPYVDHSGRLKGSIFVRYERRLLKR